MLSAHDIEIATLRAWPALESIDDGRWQARFAHGYTKRANSIHVMDPADDQRSMARIEQLAGQYRARGLIPTFRVTPLTGRETVAALDALGWPVFESSLVLTRALGSTEGFDGAAIVYEADDAKFRAAQAELNGFTTSDAEACGAILDRLVVASAGIVLVDDKGAPAASLLGVETGGIGVFLNVVTREDLRGQGYGRRIMASGLSWVAENGASHAVLQVLASNRSALSLYLALGFGFRYPYHYRRPALENS